MKTIQNILMSLAGIAIVASCTLNRLEEPEREITFTAMAAQSGDGTRTTVHENGPDIYWNPGDKIMVSYRNDNSEFVYNGEESVPVAEFQGRISGITGSIESQAGSSAFWAIYPVSQWKNTLLSDSAIMGYRAEIPSSQVAAAGTFDPKALVTLACSNTFSLAFYNVCGGVKFSVTQAGIQQVEFSSNDGTPLAGTALLLMDDAGYPAVVGEVENASSSIVLTAPYGETFEVGQWYYLTCIPGELEQGFTMTFRSETKTGELTRNDPVTVKRSVWGRLEDADADVTYTDEENTIWDETNRYFTITSQADGNMVSFTKVEDITMPEVNGSFFYSLDLGETWTSIGNWEDLAGFSHTLNNGETLSLKGDLDKTCFGYKIGIPEAATVSGNIMSLVSGDGFADVTDLDTKSAFYELFRESAVTDASELVLPALTLTNGCYERMFMSCFLLKSAPVLPASTLADSCYSSMFSGCTSLTSAPELPATTLVRRCYQFMFSGCTSLTSAPELPATIMAYGCYYMMFSGCTSLTSAPELPAISLADSCYKNMFSGCTSLTSAPELPATIMAFGCYSSMFGGCTSLTSGPELPATALADSCYSSMFAGCTSLTSAPELPATTLAAICYDDMFGGCTSLTSAPELPATTLARYCYYQMFSGCTSLTSAPELPATTLASYCYESMFRGCTSLTSAPELPATTLTERCYDSMFSGCTSLTSAPELPAATLAELCYQYMFYGCTSLTSAPELPATTLASDCYYRMFSGCTSLTSAPELPATTLANNCYKGMFYGCTNLSYVKALFTTTPSDDYTKDWLAGVAATGTFVKSAEATWDVVGPNGVPEGWTVQTDEDISGGTEGIGYDEW